MCEAFFVAILSATSEHLIYHVLLCVSIVHSCYADDVLQYYFCREYVAELLYKWIG